MEKISVKNAIISQQGEESYNYKYFKGLAQKKKINIITVKAGDKISIDKQCSFDILFPEQDLISSNVLNNNSIVAKFKYKSKNLKEFTILLTGDVEKIAENKLVDKYKNDNSLKSDILKVAHHGSKTSSTQDLLDVVRPQIALIGVGTNNKFGHPNQSTLEKLEQLRMQSL